MLKTRKALSRKWKEWGPDLIVLDLMLPGLDGLEVLRRWRDDGLETPVLVLTAKREQRKLRDQDVKTACQTACPTGAIVFGDRNDKESMVSKRMDNELNYLLLEEINVKTSVFYSAKINNRDEELDA